ncbi:uncharacterized protein LOC107614974 [Arachis ipaensis]|uniref:uncharacterized protein LOC107614974 n=1 Tax=Arachis ipaensis TaxID=130454 RepID=UPI0007AFAADB|nr:uncharacterized protein LOC107614974 [Arachis ipaensis]XP_025678052.1 uncharacterized protein LOC112777882 [Arachis hypogaea]
MKFVASSSNTKSTSNKSGIGYVLTFEEKFDEVYTSETEPSPRTEPTSNRSSLGDQAQNDDDTAQNHENENSGQDEPETAGVENLRDNSILSHESEGDPETSSTQNPSEVLGDPSWVKAMEDELQEFEMNQVWTLVPRPNGKKVTGTKWIFWNELGEDGSIARNKASRKKGPTRSERVVLDEDDDDYEPEDISPPSTTGTSASTGQKFALYEVVKDLVQEFVSQSNHMIAMSKEQRRLASKHENFFRKSRDRVAVFMTFIDNLQKDEDPATDADEEIDSEGNTSDA